MRHRVYYFVFTWRSLPLVTSLTTDGYRKLIAISKMYCQLARMQVKETRRRKVGKRRAAYGRIRPFNATLQINRQPRFQTRTTN